MKELSLIADLKPEDVGLSLFKGRIDFKAPAPITLNKELSLIRARCAHLLLLARELPLFSIDESISPLDRTDHLRILETDEVTKAKIEDTLITPFKAKRPVLKTTVEEPILSVRLLLNDA